MKFDIKNVINKAKSLPTGIIKNIQKRLPKKKIKDGEGQTGKDDKEKAEDAYSLSMDELMAGYGGTEEVHNEDVADYLSQFESEEDDPLNRSESKIEGYEEIEYDTIDNTSIPDDENNPLAAFEVDEAEDDESGSSVDDLLSEFEVSEINPLENVTVFSNDDDDAEKASTDVTVKERPTPFTMLVFSGIGLVAVLLIVLIVTVVGYMLKTSAKNKPQEIEIKTVVQGEYLPNNSNFLLTNDMKQIGKDYIILKKILIDSIANVFYFKGEVDTTKYRFVLYDSKRRTYGMDLTYLSEDGALDNTGADKSVKETIIRFEPFSQVVSGLTLEITNIETKEKASFSYSVDKAFQYSTVKYMEETVEIGEISEGVTVNIDSMIFSGAGSIVNYTIEWENDFDSSVTFDASGKGGESITMSEGTKGLPALRNAPLEYVLTKNKLLGRMDFMPVANLNAKMYIGFKDLVMNIECDTVIDLMPILNNKTGSPISLDLGDYILNFERIALKKDTIVLVYHAVDKRIAPTDKKDYSNRIEAVLNAELYIMTDVGIEIPISGDMHTGQMGGDILYNISKYSEFLQGAGDLRYSLHVKNVEIEMNDFVVPVDLSQVPTKKSEERITFENAIVNAFKTRLSYKSGRGLLSSLTGFSESLNNDESLMANYEPLKLKEQPHISIQIENSTDDYGAVVAIVRESWESTSPSDQTIIRNAHKIRIEKIGNFYTITKDEILN